LSGFHDAPRSGDVKVPPPDSDRYSRFGSSASTMIE
jgi:hypothetical protein